MRINEARAVVEEVERRGGSFRVGSVTHPEGEATILFRLSQSADPKRRLRAEVERLSPEIVMHVVTRKILRRWTPVGGTRRQ